MSSKHAFNAFFSSFPLFFLKWNTQEMAFFTTTSPRAIYWGWSEKVNKRFFFTGKESTNAGLPPSACVQSVEPQLLHVPSYSGVCLLFHDRYVYTAHVRTSHDKYAVTRMWRHFFVDDLLCTQFMTEGTVGQENTGCGVEVKVARARVSPGAQRRDFRRTVPRPCRQTLNFR